MGNNFQIMKIKYQTIICVIHNSNNAEQIAPPSIEKLFKSKFQFNDKFYQ